MYRSLKHLPRDYLAEVCDEAFGERESVMAEGEREIESEKRGGTGQKGRRGTPSPFKRYLNFACS